MPRSTAELMAILREHDALKTGHFALASGLHSGHYVQVAMLTQRPAVLHDLLQDPLREWAECGRVDVVMAAAVGGIPVGQHVALQLYARSIFCERDKDNRMALKRGFSLARGEKVLLVEDVITTGGTLDELKEHVDRAGANITGVFSVVNRSGAASWNGFPVVSVVTLDFPVYAQSDCPMCRAGVSVIRPGTKMTASSATIEREES